MAYGRFALAPVEDKPLPCEGTVGELPRNQTPPMFTHIGYPRPVEQLNDAFWGGKVSYATGKPGGFWFAPDRAWVELLSKKGSWDVRAELLDADNRAAVPYIGDVYDCVYGARKGTCPMAKADDTFLERVPSEPHYVYRFSLSGQLTDDLSSPSTTQVFRLTSANEPEFLRVFTEWKTSNQARMFKDAARFIQARRGRDISDADLLLEADKWFLAEFYVSELAPKWGGIYFDRSILAGQIAKGTWKSYLEVESGSLWHPRKVLGISEGCLAPSAVIAFAKSQADATAKEGTFARYSDRLFLAGVHSDGTIRLFKAGEAKTAGRRGRTFRRKPMRRNKNGSRLARKSQRRLRNRHA